MLDTVRAQEFIVIAVLLFFALEKDQFSWIVQWYISVVVKIMIYKSSDSCIINRTGGFMKKIFLVFVLLMFSTSVWAIVSKRVSYRMWNSSDCKALIKSDYSYCKSGDCKAVIRNDYSYCDSQNCKAVIKNDYSYCTSGDCKAVIKNDYSYCDSGDCKAFIKNDYSYCETKPCKAIIKNDYSYCQ